MSGCEPPRYKNAEEYVRPIIITQVPLAGDAGNSQLIETDEQGRELWVYQSKRYLIHFICQQHNREKVYFYEDNCFVARDPSVGLTGTELNELRILNDWNQALVPNKMSFRTLHWTTEAQDYDWVTADTLINSAVAEQQKCALKFDPFDYNGNGKHLWLIQASTKEKPRFEEAVFYFAIITRDDGKESISDLLALDDLYAYQAALHQFKEENGWFLTE